MPPDPVEDPRLRICVSASICANPRQDAYLRTYVEASLSVVSGYITRSVAQDHLQDPCLRILHRRLMFPDPCLSIHVFGSLYKIYALGPAASSMSPRPLQDSSLRIYVSVSISAESRNARSMSLASPHLHATPLEQKTRVSASIAVDSLLDEPKSTRRYSESNSTRRKPADGCICKHEIGTAPQRDAKNQSSNHTWTSASQYEIKKQISTP